MWSEGSERHLQSLCHTRPRLRSRERNSRLLTLQWHRFQVVRLLPPCWCWICEFSGVTGGDGVLPIQFHAKSIQYARQCHAALLQLTGFSCGLESSWGLPLWALSWGEGLGWGVRGGLLGASLCGFCSTTPPRASKHGGYVRASEGQKPNFIKPPSFEPFPCTGLRHRSPTKMKHRTERHFSATWQPSGACERCSRRKQPSCNLGCHIQLQPCCETVTIDFQLGLEQTCRV